MARPPTIDLNGVKVAGASQADAAGAAPAGTASTEPPRPSTAEAPAAGKVAAVRRAKKTKDMGPEPQDAAVGTGTPRTEADGSVPQPTVPEGGTRSAVRGTAALSPEERRMKEAEDLRRYLAQQRIREMQGVIGSLHGDPSIAKARGRSRDRPSQPDADRPSTREGPVTAEQVAAEGKDVALVRTKTSAMKAAVASQPAAAGTVFGGFFDVSAVPAGAPSTESLRPSTAELPTAEGKSAGPVRAKKTKGKALSPAGAAGASQADAVGAAPAGTASTESPRPSTAEAPAAAGKGAALARPPTIDLNGVKVAGASQADAAGAAPAGTASTEPPGIGALERSQTRDLIQGSAHTGRPVKGPTGLAGAEAAGGQVTPRSSSRDETRRPVASEAQLPVQRSTTRNLNQLQRRL